MVTNYKSWKFTAKLIRIVHNRDVKRHYKNVQANNPNQKNNNNALEQGLLIYPNDSALVILNKQIMFRTVIQESSVISQPESWLTNSRRGNDIPQLIIIYRIKRNNKSGSYQVTIPHYNGSKSIKPPEYTKGNEPIVFKMKDNSGIVINCSDAEKGKNIIKYFLGFCNKKYVDNMDNYIYPSKTRVRKDLMVPIRADYFEDGQKNLNPTWRIYF